MQLKNLLSMIYYLKKCVNTFAQGYATFDTNYSEKYLIAKI